MATKQLSYLIRRKIGLKGYAARPYVQNVLKSGIIEQFQNKVSELLKREIIIEVNLK
jgi:hypothetical protein